MVIQLMSKLVCRFQDNSLSHTCCLGGAACRARLRWAPVPLQSSKAWQCGVSSGIGRLSTWQLRVSTTRQKPPDLTHIRCVIGMISLPPCHTGGRNHIPVQGQEQGKPDRNFQGKEYQGMRAILNLICRAVQHKSLIRSCVPHTGYVHTTRTHSNKNF